MTDIGNGRAARPPVAIPLTPRLAAALADFRYRQQRAHAAASSLEVGTCGRSMPSGHASPSGQLAENQVMALSNVRVVTSFPPATRVSVLPSLNSSVESLARDSPRDAQNASAHLRSTVVADVIMGDILDAGTVPRQEASFPLSPAREARVISRTMNGKDLVERIESRLKELGISAQAASLKVGDNRDLIRNVTRFGADANPKAETVALIARALDLPLNALLPDERPAPPNAMPPRQEFRLADQTFPSPATMPMDLPVWGTAMGSLIDTSFEGFQFFSGEPVDYVRRPPALMGVRDAYGIYVSGDSMDPMHPHGALRMVHPHRPVQPGNSVVVSTRRWDDDPGQGYIKILRRRMGDRLLLEQLNPPARIEIPVKYVTSVHKVLDLNDLFGV